MASGAPSASGTPRLSRLPYNGSLHNVRTDKLLLCGTIATRDILSPALAEEHPRGMRQGKP